MAESAHVFEHRCAEAAVPVSRVVADFEGLRLLHQHRGDFGRDQQQPQRTAERRVQQAQAHQHDDRAVADTPQREQPKQPEQCIDMQHIAGPADAGVHQAKNAEHGEPAQIERGSTLRLCLLHARKLDRETDAEQQAEHAVELAREQHAGQREEQHLGVEPWNGRLRQKAPLCGQEAPSMTSAKKGIVTVRIACMGRESGGPRVFEPASVVSGRRRPRAVRRRPQRRAAMVPVAPREPAPHHDHRPAKSRWNKASRRFHKSSARRIWLRRASTALRWQAGTSPSAARHSSRRVTASRTPPGTGIGAGAVASASGVKAEFGKEAGSRNVTPHGSGRPSLVLDSASHVAHRSSRCIRGLTAV